MARRPLINWIVLSLAWIAAIGTLAWNSWPHLPLDVSHTDPATRAAYDWAVAMHAARYAALALLPPLIGVVIYRFFTK